MRRTSRRQPIETPEPVLRLTEAKEICHAIEVIVATTQLPSDSSHLKALCKLHNRIESFLKKCHWALAAAGS